MCDGWISDGMPPNLTGPPTLHPTIHRKVMCANVSIMVTVAMQSKKRITTCS